MTNILELIKNEKVEWKQLGEVCKEKFWMMPATPKFINDKRIPYITGKNIRQGEIDFTKVKYISEEDFNNISKNRKLKVDDILVSMIGTIGEIGIINDGEKFYGQNLYVLRLDKDKVINRYFYYYFSQSKVKEKLVSKKNTSSQGYIRAGQLECLEIPIPSLETQEKIVEILDKFTNYVIELQSEFQSRTKQYTYYRDMLLSEEYLNKITKEMEEDGVEWKKLGEIGSFVNGSGMPKTMFDDKGDVGAIHYGHIYTKYNLFVKKPLIQISKENSTKLKKVEFGDIVIAKTSENIDDVMKSVAYLGEEIVVVGGHSAIYSHKQNPKYLSYVFNGSRDVIKQKNKLARGVKVIELSSVDMTRIKIPLPSLRVQQHIVSILDKFDTLVNDIKEGLPKEIEQRQKQYEYWREQLLSFSK